MIINLEYWKIYLFNTLSNYSLQNVDEEKKIFFVMSYSIF